MSIKDAAKIAGVHYNTAQGWDAKKRQAKAELEIAKLDGGTVRKKVGGVQADAWAN
jgi:transposase